MSYYRMWLVAPIYFDVESFLVLRDEIYTSLRAYPHEIATTFVVVDDSAGLDPAVSALAGLPDVALITPLYNLGHQRAIVLGLRTIAKELHDEDIVVTLDADGEDRPEDLGHLLDALLADENDFQTMVLARRTKRRETALFKILYFGFRLGFRVLTGTIIRTGNYAVYRGWTARRLLFHPSFNLSYSSTLVRLGLDIVFVPCERGMRYRGQSKMSLGGLLMHGFRMLMPFVDRIAVRALIAFSLVFACALVMLTGLLALRFATGSAFPGWALASAGLVLVVCFVALGNFVVLFAVFSHLQGAAFDRLEIDSGSLGEAPTISD